MGLTKDQVLKRQAQPAQHNKRQASSLSRGLRRLYHEGLVKSYHLGRDSMLISHLLFADDTLIFLRGYKKSLQNLMGFLRLYEASFG